MAQDIIITNLNICRNQLLHLNSIIVFPYAVMHQLSITTASNTSTIIVRKTRLTIALCVYIVVLDLFYIKRLFTNTFFIHF